MTVKLSFLYRLNSMAEAFGPTFDGTISSRLVQRTSTRGSSDLSLSGYQDSTYVLVSIYMNVSSGNPLIGTAYIIKRGESQRMMCPANAVANVDLTINFASNGTVSMKFNTSTGVNDVFFAVAAL